MDNELKKKYIYLYKRLSFYASTDDDDGDDDLHFLMEFIFVSLFVLLFHYVIAKFKKQHIACCILSLFSYRIESISLFPFAWIFVFFSFIPHIILFHGQKMCKF